jgi:hypothetical protein
MTADPAYYLSIYIHAHKTGNSVPPHIEAEAIAALKAKPEPVERLIWTEGVCGDGAAILKDGVMQPIEDVIAALNAAELVQSVPACVACDGSPAPENSPCAVCGAVLQRYARPAITPVPVIERPWEREGFCDAEGRCWFSAQAVGGHYWSLWPRQKWLPGTGYCLPHWALPIPTTDNIQ